jgi:CRISPR-associated protein Cas2
VLERLSKYKIVWLQVCFDLPVDTRKLRKEYAIFRKRLLNDGYFQMQYSVYLRFCGSHESADVHERRLNGWIPSHGHVWLLRFTDTQFGNSKHFWGKDRDPKTNMGPGAQLELF